MFMNFKDLNIIKYFTRSKNASTNTTTNTTTNTKDGLHNLSEIDTTSEKIITWNDTVPFTFPLTNGYVIKVYDGDTITIASKLPFVNSPLYRFPVRLNGIDSPEIKGKTDDEKTAAIIAREELKKLILNKEIILKNVQNEKYGRVLADVYIGELHVNNWMIQQGYAVKYDGGTKTTPESWLYYQMTFKK